MFLSVYIDFGLNPDDDVQIKFSFANGQTGTRKFDIKASQITCTAIGYRLGSLLMVVQISWYLLLLIRPPEGCLQYMMGLSGTFQTFNFLGTGSTNTASQE